MRTGVFSDQVGKLIGKKCCSRRGKPAHQSRQINPICLDWCKTKLWLFTSNLYVAHT